MFLEFQTLGTYVSICYSFPPLCFLFPFWLFWRKSLWPLIQINVTTDLVSHLTTWHHLAILSLFLGQFLSNSCQLLFQALSILHSNDFTTHPSHSLLNWLPHHLPSCKKLKLWRIFLTYNLHLLPYYTLIPSASQRLCKAKFFIWVPDNYFTQTFRDLALSLFLSVFNTLHFSLSVDSFPSAYKHTQNSSILKTKPKHFSFIMDPPLVFFSVSCVTIKPEVSKIFVYIYCFYSFTSHLPFNHCNRNFTCTSPLKPLLLGTPITDKFLYAIGTFKPLS